MSNDTVAPALTVQVGLSDQALRLIASIEESLSALEQLPEFPFDSFLRLTSSFLAQLSVEPLRLAPGTGDDRALLQVVGDLEVLAAALSALDGYFRHVAAPSRG